MEKVRFACPRCQTIMQTGAEKVGYDVACPHCAHRFRLIESGEHSTSSRTDSASPDDTTLPPSSFSGSTNQPGHGSSGAVNVPNPYKAPIDAFGSNRRAPVVSHYPPSTPTSTTQGGFCCPYCQTTRPPRWKSEVSQIGWIVFAVLLVTTCVCCFVGLFIRDKYRVCSQCNIRLG